MTCIMASRRQFLHASKTSYSVWRYFSSTSYVQASQRYSDFQAKTKANDEAEKSIEPAHFSLLARKMIQSMANDQTRPKMSESLQKTITDLREDVSTENFRERLHAVSHEVGSTIRSVESLRSKKVLVDERPEEDKSIELLAFPDELKNLESPSPFQGTEDPSVKRSRIPCTGCGAFLQCNHKILPGFMVSEIFKVLTEKDLRNSICQRCYYMRHCDAFVEVKAKPEDYAKMISKIRPTRSVVVMVVDMLDMRGSIVPQLSEYIGTGRPLVIVGNKADLLAPDCLEYLQNAKNSLMRACKDAGLTEVKSYNLVSAKTGFGVEKLISTLFSFYRSNVDVYIVGTANAGKSSLFNMLLASDYCALTARDLIQRATVSQWPGTTLNLLKFPIMKYSYRTANLRFKRLKQQKAMRNEQNRLQKEQKSNVQEEELKSWELTENVKTTDVRTEDQVEMEEKGHAWGQNLVSFRGGRDGRIIPFTNDDKSEFMPEVYKEGYWAYDTPGIINPDQIVNLLTPEECTHMTPTSMIVPRSLVIQARETVFISGLARIDFLEGNSPLVLTVHAAAALPIRMGPVDDADMFYRENVGTETLLIPSGDKERLSKLPPLSGEEFALQGNGPREASADIQLSSIGYVSVAADKGKKVNVKVWTPGGKGIYLGEPALQPHFYMYKGKRMGLTPYYATKPPGYFMYGKVHEGLDGDEEEITRRQKRTGKQGNLPRRLDNLHKLNSFKKDING